MSLFLCYALYIFYCIIQLCSFSHFFFTSLFNNISFLSDSCRAWHRGKCGALDQPAGGCHTAAPCLPWRRCTPYLAKALPFPLLVPASSGQDLRGSCSSPPTLPCCLRGEYKDGEEMKGRS